MNDDMPPGREKVAPSTPDADGNDCSPPPSAAEAGIILCSDWYADGTVRVYRRYPDGTEVDEPMR